jgi:hypothetical protein
VDEFERLKKARDCEDATGRRVWDELGDRTLSFDALSEWVDAKIELARLTEGGGR